MNDNIPVPKVEESNDAGLEQVNVDDLPPLMQQPPGTPQPPVMPQPQSPVTPQPQQPALQQGQIAIDADVFNGLVKRLEALERGGQEQGTSDLAKTLSILNRTLERQEEAGNSSLRGAPTFLSYEELGDDYMENPVTFFAWGKSKSVADDVRNGVAVRTPYKRSLKFRNLYSHIQPSNGFQKNKVVAMAKFTTHSRKEAEFMRNHSLFGTVYFETLTQVKQVPYDLSNFIATELARVDRMTPKQVMDLAVQTGVTMVQDIPTLKKNVAIKIAEDKHKRETSMGAPLIGDVVMVPSEHPAGQGALAQAGVDRAQATVY